jgi:hypothetical protein
VWGTGGGDGFLFYRMRDDWMRCCGGKTTLRGLWWACG